MGIYFEEEQKEKRWESGQAILHREGAGKKKEETKKRGDTAYGVKNSYGKLRYLRGEKRKRYAKEGFALEALEAPGTRPHTEKEKRISRKTMRAVGAVGKQTLYASELPFKNQAFFFDMAGSKRSRKFVKYMKELLCTQGHETLRDTFGFLDQEPERKELEVRGEARKDALSPEMSRAGSAFSEEERRAASGRRIDTLNSRLHRKEAKERQLCGELQLMLEERAREQFREGRAKRAGKEQEASEKKRRRSKKDDFLRRQRQLGDNAVEIPVEGEAEDGTEEEKFITG